MDHEESIPGRQSCQVPPRVRFHYAPVSGLSSGGRAHRIRLNCQHSHKNKEKVPGLCCVCLESVYVCGEVHTYTHKSVMTHITAAVCNKA